jgi:hypothetical protein
MATEIATLKFKADTSDLSRAERMLKRLGAASRDAANDYDYLTDEQRDQEDQQRRNNRENEKGKKSLQGLGKAAKGAAAAIGLIAGAQKTLEVAREFDVINASLITMTGSTENAARAFGQIQQFAATTPYDLQQVSQAFVKLKALGLDPSEEALRSYGNTASAMGKSLDQFIEAVADASTMEFERLKEFGIKARQEGDNVSLTFRGVTTTIGKNADEIQGYLLAIGQTEFAGAMAERAATLDGAFSNLSDTVDQFFLSLTRGQTGGLINDVTRAITASIQDLVDSINLINGTASLDLQLESQVAESRRLQSELDRTPEIFADQRAKIEAKLKESLQAEADIIKQMRDEIAANEEQRRLDEFNRLDSARAEALRVEKEKQAEIDAAQEKTDQRQAQRDEQQRQRDEARANSHLQQMMRLNADELTQVDNIEKDRLAILKSSLDQGLIDKQEYEDAKTEIERAAEAERKQIREDARLAEQEARLAEFEALMEQREAELERDRQDAEIKEQAKIDAAQKRADAINAIDDIFLKNSSDKDKAAFRLATSLMDAEKRERAKEIVSKSYNAAMGAYEALAPIPYVGPALGAAAAAAILAQGVQMAAQSLSGRALGGQVRAGESYVVGERGPEVLTMGNMNGKIATNESLRGAQPMVNKTANVSFNIQANDTTGFDELLLNRRGLIINVINEALNDQGKAAIA